MKPFPPDPALLAVARRVVWFKPPEAALADPVHFLAHVMTYGACRDLKALAPWAGDEEYREALTRAPPGVFDARSWAYWNLRLGVDSALPLPVRSFSR